MPDVQIPCTLSTLALRASVKAVKLYRNTLGYVTLALVASAMTVVAVPELHAQTLAAQDAVITPAVPAVKESAILKSAAALEARIDASADAVKTAATDTRQQLRDLQEYIGSKYKVPTKAVSALVDTAWEVGGAMKLDPLLLLAVMAIESSFNPRAESHVGAQGLMQVMTRIHHKKFEPFGGKKAAWHPDANINVGAQILKECIARRGSVSGGLTCYVGSPGTSSQYGKKVLAERKRLEARLGSDGGVDALMLASAPEPVEPAAQSSTKSTERTKVAATTTVDEEAANIVAQHGGDAVAVNEVTASFSLRAGSVEM